MTTRTGMARGRIAIVDRIDAVVAAMRINALTGGHCFVVPEPFAIIAALKQPAIDRELIRKWADKLLALELTDAGAIARLRVCVCHLENACGLYHDDRSVAAMLAQANPDSWRTLVEQIARAQPIEIEVEVQTPYLAEA